MQAGARIMSSGQKMVAKAVTGVFKTVAREVAEAEAGILPAKQRHRARAAAMWIDIQTLPATQPLRLRNPKDTQHFPSPLLVLKKAAKQPAGGQA